tara:strand:- start:1105 stop:2025 length:921 start_codon:yes stop_codon:yes gene_type:complete
MIAYQQKIAIVTGANTGLGYETSLGLAKESYTVVLACRSEAKAQAAIDKIAPQAPSASLDFIPLDLINRDNIRQFAATFSERYNHLNILVNNAGVMGPPHTITKNNLELQFDANHVGHFYLTSLLMDKLDQTFETRIVNVSSLAGKREHADIHFDNLNFEGNYEEGPKFMGVTGLVAYSQSKLANILFTMELKDRLEAAGKNIKSVVVHPGVSNTDLARNFPVVVKILAPVLLLFMNVSKPAQGAESSLYGALNPAVKAGDFIGPTGKGERAGAPGQVELPAKASDKALCEKLWSVSEELLDISFL